MRRNFKKQPINCLLNITSIMSFHYFDFRSDFRYEGERHDYWELVYVDRGTAVATVNDHSVILKQGEIIFHQPDEFHAASAFQQDPPTVFIITFHCDSPQMEFFNGKHMNVPTPLRRYISEMIADGQEAYVLDGDSPYAGAVQKRDDATIGSEQLIKNNLELFLLKLIRFSAFSKPESTVQDAYNPLTSKVIEILTNHVYGRVTVESISAQLGFSRAHIASVFKQDTGKTMTEYLTSLKISEAKYLIRKGHYTISQISDFLCFDNPHYFCRVFKKETKLTPTQYILSVSYPDEYASQT